MATEKFGLLCYSTGSNGPNPDGYVLPEIHLNIWEQEISGKEDEEIFLDIGLMFSIKESAKTIELIFPWKVSLSEITDLSGVIGVSDAIPAIFNESWAVSDHGGDHVVYDPRQVTGAGFSIVSVNKALSEQDHEAQWGTGSTLKQVKCMQSL
jgi:hypothetical protein